MHASVTLECAPQTALGVGRGRSGCILSEWTFSFVTIAVKRSLAMLYYVVTYRLQYTIRTDIRFDMNQFTKWTALSVDKIPRVLKIVNV